MIIYNRSRYKNIFLLALLLAVFVITIISQVGTSYSLENSDKGINQKVIIVSMPRVTWEMLDQLETPNIDRVINTGSAGSLSILTPGNARTLENGYISISAGNRAAAATSNKSTFYMIDERIKYHDAKDIFRDQRGNYAKDASALSLGYEQTLKLNNEELYKPDIGALASVLEKNSKSISVIGNADYCSKKSEGCNQRAIGYLGSNRNGEIKFADVSRDILNPDLSLNMKIVKSKAVKSIEQHDVTAVECSDLEKIDLNHSSYKKTVLESKINSAISDCDNLIGSVLENIDLGKDRIFIISPVSPAAKEQLTIFVAAGKNIQPGYAISGITRREGIVSLADIAPSILDFYNIDTPETMEATLLDWVKSSDSVQEKKHSLIQMNKKAALRDDSFVVIAASFILIVFLTVILSIFAYRSYLKLRNISKILALLSLSMPSATFILSPFMLSLGTPIKIYIAFFSISLLITAISYIAMKKFSVALIILTLSAGTLLIQLVDILTGGNLQLNSLFGYSAVIAGRFAGFGNLAFSIVAISCVVLVAMTKQLGLKRPKLNSTWVNIALIAILVLTIALDGLPYFGSDVGGVLALTPMSFIVGLMLFNKRISYKYIILSGVITFVTISIFSLFDLSRPVAERTHLGRFVEVMLNGEGRTIIERKISSNFQILTNSLIATVIIVATIFLMFLFLRPEKFVKRTSSNNPGIRYIVYPGLVVGILGMLLNDSGVAIPGMMLSIAAPALALISFEISPKGELDTTS